MSRIYDNWEKLVGAVLNREDLRQLALCESFSSSNSSSRPSFDSSGVCQDQLLTAVGKDENYQIPWASVSKENKVTGSTTTRPNMFQIQRMKNSVGIGYHVDLNNGITTINLQPELPSKRVIQNAEQSFPQKSDPVIRFPAPNEREINKNKSTQSSSPSIPPGLNVKKDILLPQDNYWS